MNMMNDYPEKLLELSEICKENYKIPASVFANANVKRGLRNADGSGVVAGATNLGLIHGYVLYEGEKRPDEGKLYYRGYDVEKLIDAYVKENRYGFEECAFILLFGSLPTSEQLDAFNALNAEYATLPQNFTEDVIMRAPSPDIMNKIQSGIVSLYSYDPNPEDMSLENQLKQSIQIISRLPIIAAHAYSVKRHVFDQDSLLLHRPLPGLACAQNFMRILGQDVSFDEKEARLLDLCLVLHAEHGGANIKVDNMFTDIKEHVRDWNDDDEIRAYLEKILNKEAGDGSGLIYGMGHAIYTNSDPRAIALKKYAKELAGEKGFKDEFELLQKIETLSPDVFHKVTGNSKFMCANVDMYSGLVYRMLGIPRELFTPLFATARVAGWCAHRIEEILTGGKIIRPAYKTNYSIKEYVPIDERM